MRYPDRITIMLAIVFLFVYVYYRNDGLAVVILTVYFPLFLSAQIFDFTNTIPNHGARDTRGRYKIGKICFHI